MQKKTVIKCSVLIFVLMLIPLVAAQATILKVGPSETYTTIQAAVDVASAGDEIWVQSGTYTLGATIDIGKAISLYGGFTGSETLRSQRNWTTNATIIDGNNSVRCFMVYSTITIDGFTITKGNNSSKGAGIWNGKSATSVSGYLTLNNCILSNNVSTGDSGGAILNDWGTLTINNCTFSGNTANATRAGAIANYGSDMTITNCTFTGNTSNNGGAIYYPNTAGTPSATAQNVFTNCVFRQNSALSSTSDGGVIICDGNTTMTNCVFDQNTANRYGTVAFYGDPGFSHVFTNCLFTGNTAQFGAGICINGNKSGFGGLTVMNCTFAGNTVKTGGAGCAIYTRRTSLTSGAIFAVTNSILWGGVNGIEIDRYNSAYPLPTVSYTDIDQSGYAGSNGNINTDPKFVGSGDYHLQISAPCTIISPCIDAGTSAGAPANDLDGVTRPQISGFDMGAYEMQCPTLIELSSFTATPANAKVILEWSTASELDNAGFNIYRAGADGAYVQINDEIIPADGNSANGAAYQFVDNNVQNRQTYSYKLEDVDLNGAKTMHGPVQATPRFIYLFQ
jgi:predicted outer membrane repeat protein